MKAVSPFLTLIHLAFVLFYILFFAYAQYNSDLIAALISIGFILTTFLSQASLHIILIRRFYNRNFGKEGYLYHSLPVRTDSLMCSHGLTYFVWVWINQLILLVTTIYTIVVNSSDYTMENWNLFMTYYGSEFWQFVGMLVLFICAFAILAATLSQLITSISSFFPTHKLFACIAGYIVSGMILLTGLSRLFEFIDHILITSTNDSFQASMSVLWYFIGFALVVSIINYLVTRFILTRHLNLV